MIQFIIVINLFLVLKCNIQTMLQHGILERLYAGEVIVGDGGMCHALEKRGYVKAGPWTPECTVEHPEAGEKMAQFPCSKTISSKFIKTAIIG